MSKKVTYICNGQGCKVEEVGGLFGEMPPEWTDGGIEIIAGGQRHYCLECSKKRELSKQSPSEKRFEEKLRDLEKLL